MSTVTNWRFVLLAAAIAGVITVPGPIRAAAIAVWVFLAEAQVRVLLYGVWVLQQVGG